MIIYWFVLAPEQQEYCICLSLQCSHFLLGFLGAFFGGQVHFKIDLSVNK